MTRPSPVPHSTGRRIGLAAAVAAVASAALLLAGCAGSSGTDQTPKPTTTSKSADVTGSWGDAAKESAPAIELAGDGTLTGTDGCNRLTGSWKLEGDTIAFGELASTKMACIGVDTWLSGARTATVSGSTMTVLGEGGAELGTLDRADTGTNTKDPVSEAFLGSWGSTAQGKPNLSISGDGRFTGNDGCNGLSGSWKAGNADAITFSEAVSTLMACPGIDAKLGQLASAKVSGDTLTVLDAKGAELAKLERSRS